MVYPINPMGRSLHKKAYGISLSSPKEQYDFVKKFCEIFGQWFILPGCLSKLEMKPGLTNWSDGQWTMAQIFSCDEYLFKTCHCLQIIGKFIDWLVGNNVIKILIGESKNSLVYKWS